MIGKTSYAEDVIANATFTLYFWMGMMIVKKISGSVRVTSNFTELCV